MVVALRGCGWAATVAAQSTPASRMANR